MRATTAATVKTYTYLAEEDVLLASTSTQDHALCVHLTATLLKQGYTHHALDVQVRLLLILVPLDVLVQQARTGVKHFAFSVQLAHSGVEAHVSLVQARLLLIEELLIAPVQLAHT